MNALAKILAWPTLKEDLVGLALWDAVEIARPTRSSLSVGQARIFASAFMQHTPWLR